MTSAPYYADVTEAAAIIAAHMVSTDTRRIAFEAASADDQLIHLRQATGLIDAVMWDGYPASTTQEAAWPRLTYRSTADTAPTYTPGSDVGYIDPDPNEAASATVAAIPANVRIACVVQASVLAEEAAGINATRQIHEQANAGMMSLSTGRVSHSIDGRRANSAWARLHPDVQALLRRYRRVTGVMS